MFDPADDRRGWIHYLERGQPYNRGDGRMEHYCLRVQRVVVNTRWSLLTATMRRWHVVHLSALVLHHAAAGALFGIHFRVRNHAGHCRSQT